MGATELPDTSDRDALLELLRLRVEQMALNIEKMKIAEYVELLGNPWRLMYVNFLAGVARGIGAAVGWALLATALLAVLRALVLANLPLIGGLIADLVELVQNQLAR